MGTTMPAMTIRSATHCCGRVIAVVLVSLSVCAAWETKQDNKPDSVLEAMSSEELFNEGLDVCVQRALLARSGEATGTVNPGAADAAAYLGHIADVVRAQHGGTAPEWMADLVTAETTKECQRAFHSFLEERAPPTQPEPTEPQPTKPQTPRPRRHPGSQLPPWLAPPRE
jgi:hypothetical protein